VTAASVIVPTHDAASTLDLAVGSALAQTVDDLEVVIVGDGVTSAVRSVVEGLVRGDPRVRFLDRPKGAHHGEVHRDEAVRTAHSPVICYLCDDDLLLPDHVASMVALLADHDLAQSLNGHIDPGGSFHPYFGDLASDDHRRWLLHPHCNTVSVTGTGHTLDSYLRLEVGWRPPPPGRWTDHVLWQRFLALPDLRAVTSDRVTAVQLPTTGGGRHTWSPAERRAELERWTRRLAQHDGLGFLDDVVRKGLNARGAVLLEAEHELSTELDAARRALDAQRDQARQVDARAAALQAEVEAHVRSLRALRAELQTSSQRVADLEHRLALVEGSRTWRTRNAVVRGPLRRLVRGASPGSPS
jgi:hypothetical protein